MVCRTRLIQVKLINLLIHLIEILRKVKLMLENQIINSLIMKERTRQLKMFSFKTYLSIKSRQ